MNILVLYGTSEGQTGKIAEYSAECLRGRQHDIVLAAMAADSSQLDLSAFDAAIVASRVHAGRHHRAIIAFARRHHQLLAAMDTALLSVSMSAAHQSAQDSEKLAQYRTRFVKAAGWEPGCYHDVAGARLYARHNRLTRWILGLVDHHQFDTTKDHEFTDWLDLRTFVDDWTGRLAPSKALDPSFAGTVRRLMWASRGPAPPFPAAKARSLCTQTQSLKSARWPYVFLGLAVDYDGTIAHDGRVAAETLAALERVKVSGRLNVVAYGSDQGVRSSSSGAGA